MEYTAAEIKEMVTKHETATTSLRQRMKDDYNLFVLDKYYMSKEKGKHDETITCNSPATLGGKVIEYLSDAEKKFKVLLQAKGTATTQVKGTNNELFCIAFDCLAEEYWQSYPEHGSLLGEASFYATIFGGIARRVYLWQDEDKIVPDVAEWSILNTFWGTGSKGLDWAAYRRYTTEKEIRDLYEYKGSITADEDGVVKVTDHWTGEWEKVVIGSDVVYKNQHELGYVPVFIRGVGATPLVQGLDKIDAIKYWGESIYQYNRTLYELENEIATYYLNTIQMGVKTPKVLWYTGVPPTDNPFDSDPFRKGGVVLLDKGRYDSLEDFVKPTMPADSQYFLNWLEGKMNTGGLPPISYGDAERMQTLGGLNLLNHNAMTVLKPRKKTIENEYTWTANEFIRQYKAGKFKEVELSGIDSKKKQYSISKDSEDIDEKQRVTCELMLNLPTDELQNAGIVTTLVKEGLYSRQRGMDKLGVEDTEAELDNIDMEKLRVIPQVQLPVVAAELIRRKKFDEAKAVLTYMQSQGQIQEQQGAPLGQMPGVAQPMNPQQMMKKVPAELVQKARLARMGMVQG